MIQTQLQKQKVSSHFASHQDNAEQCIILVSIVHVAQSSTQVQGEVPSWFLWAFLLERNLEEWEKFPKVGLSTVTDTYPCLPILFIQIPPSCAAITSSDLNGLPDGITYVPTPEGPEI